MDRIDQFIRIVKYRSKENTDSILSLFESGNFGTAISILRQELDTLIRVCYLNTLNDQTEVDRLIKSTLEGTEWTKNGNRITDRKMVNVASQYNHWAPEVYHFGNCFTHLTNYHDYKFSDPLDQLDDEYKIRIRKYLSSYHQFPIDAPVTFKMVKNYIPKVAAKISNNLKSYVNELQD